ncbi:MAG: tyrosine-type recombinase/integrase, partial [Gammaproteobacteria bacterium]|nr:tyrosine-type recombinase/integrase [Gammaproteobacteria bacterium]
VSGIDAKASPHWFRHTLAKRVMKNSTASDPLKTVQILLNHSDPRSTAAYTLPDKEDIVLAAEEIAS